MMGFPASCLLSLEEPYLFGGNVTEDAVRRGTRLTFLPNCNCAVLAVVVAAALPPPLPHPPALVCVEPHVICG